MKQMHILDQMKPEEVAELKAQSVTKTFQRREIIFHKEDTPKYLYVLLEGAVCVFDDTPDGTRNILTIIREPMDCFAEVYLFIDEKLPFSAEAMKKSTVLMIPRSAPVSPNQPESECHAFTKSIYAVTEAEAVNEGQPA